MYTRVAAVVLALVQCVAGIDNGIGMTPPMGWRSWNAYHSDVDQSLMEKVMSKMTERKWKNAEGTLVSVADIGYTNVGLDDNWQACGTGYQRSFHDSNGNPLVNTSRFPNMTAMTSYGHHRNLRVGWYMNNCICSENTFTDPTYIAKHMERSAYAVAEAGFDSVKLVGCGQFRNLSWWADLLNATGRPIMIENCHWGQTVPGQDNGDAPCSGTGTPSDCPYNFYRSSEDIQPNWESMFDNLQSTISYQGYPPLSRPGAWAYPDMLEVGNLASHEEDRSHFGAWCIVSSPLILGYDMSDDAVTARVWDVISNTEAIAVNQAWAGHPGRLVASAATSGVISYQVWGKLLPSSSQAAFVINNEPTSSVDVAIDFTRFNFYESETVSVRDIWSREDLGTAVGTFKTGPIAPHDSRFYTFSRLETI